jgi:integrase
LIDQLDQEYRVQGRKSIDEMRHHVKPILRLLGDRRAEGLTPGVLRQYAATRQQEGRSNATINREFAALRRAMNLAMADDLIARVPKFPMLRETGLRQGTYTREEFDRIVAELPTHLQPVATFAYLTGRRRGEILQLRWEDVNFQEGYVCVRAGTTKTGEPDRIPLAGNLGKLLQSLKDEDCSLQGKFIFSYQGKPFKSFQRSWKQAAKRAGLPDRLFHDFRRSAATDLIEAGVSEQVAMRVTGHRTRAVFARYNIVKSDSVRDAMARLEDYRRGK